MASNLIVRQWTPGRCPRLVEMDKADPAAEVTWIDVDIASLGEFAGRDFAHQSAALYEQIEHLCRGQLEQPMLTDLLGTGSQPDDRAYGDGQVRLTVAFQAATREGRGQCGPGGTAREGTLVCQPVGFLAGDGWIVTCWHPPLGYRGAQRIPVTEEPEPHSGISDCVAKRWIRGPAKTAGDLGVLILNELALSYASAHRRIYAWLEEWELTFYLTDVDGEPQVIDRATLPDLWGAMAVLRHWISPLNRSGMRTNIDKAWFSGCSDHAAVENVDERVDRALDALRKLGETLRASFGLLRLQLEEEQRKRTERLQRLIEYVTAAILIPALVVGFYGSNTRLPGQETWWGFWIMVGVMVGLGLGSLLILRMVRARNAVGPVVAASDPARARAGLS